MNITKLNLIVISTVCLLGVEAHAGGNPPVNGGAPLAKRAVLLSLGQVSLSTSDISSNLAGNGFSDASANNTDDANTIAVGYRMPFGRRYSVDMTYIDQGSVSASVTADPASGKTGAQTAADVAKSMPINGSGLNYAALMHFPVINGVTAQAGAGAFIWTNEREATVDSVTHVEEDSGVSAMAQLGLNFSIMRGVSVEMKAQRFFMPGDDADRLSLGVAVGF